MLLLSIRFLDRNPLYLGLRISEATQLKTIDELATLDVPEEEQVSKAEAEEISGKYKDNNELAARLGNRCCRCRLDAEFSKGGPRATGPQISDWNTATVSE